MHTGFCSPSSTRSFGATPFARSSLSWSDTYCRGFCFDGIVAVSDTVALLTWNRLLEELFCVSSRRGANDLNSKHNHQFVQRARAFGVGQIFPASALCTSVKAFSN